MSSSEIGVPNEPYESPEGSAPKKSSIGKRVAQGVGGVVLAVGGLWLAGNSKLILEHLGGATPQEQQISDLTHRAFGEALTIRCVSVIEGDTAEAVAATTRSFMGIIDPITQIQDSRCDALSEFMTDPGDPPTQDTLDAFLDLGHEYSHVAKKSKSTDNEGGAQCMGVQRIGLLAEAAGAAAEDAAAIQREIALEQVGVETIGPSPENWGVIPPSCVPGGEFDLGLPNTVLPRVGYMAG